MTQTVNGSATFPPNISLKTFVSWYFLTTLGVAVVSAASFIFISVYFQNEDKDFMIAVRRLTSLISMYVSPLILLILMKLKFKDLSGSIRGIWGKLRLEFRMPLCLNIVLTAIILELIYFLCGANDYVGMQTLGSFGFSLIKFIPNLVIDLLLVYGLLQRRYLERPLRVNLMSIAAYWLILKAVNYAFSLIKIAISHNSPENADVGIWSLFTTRYFSPLPEQLVAIAGSLIVLLFSAYLYKRTRSLTPALVFNLLLWLFNGILGFFPAEWVLL